MYLSLGQAAKEAGVAKSTISKALASGKLSYREKNSEGYKIDPAELFRVYPKTSKNSAEETASNDWQLGQASGETIPYSARFRDPARWPQESSRGKGPPHHRPRIRPRAASRRPPPADRELAGRAGPAPKIARGSDRHREASDRRAGKARGGSPTHLLAAGLRPQTSCGGIGFHLPRRVGGIFVASAKRVRIKACCPGGLRCLRPTRSISRHR